jgi:hypothetical protein
MLTYPVCHERVVIEVDLKEVKAMAQQYKLGKRSTTVYKKDGILRVTYHNTVIVEVAPNGDITLNSGGWWTQTTKTRMNQAASQFDLGYHVYQEDSQWYVKTYPYSRLDPPIRFGGGNGYEHVILSGKSVAA